MYVNRVGVLGWVFLLCVVGGEAGHVQAAEIKLDTKRGDAMIAAYFKSQVSALEKANDLTQFKTLKDWEKVRGRYRAELFDMLGLSPLPKKTPLKAKVVGSVTREDIVVEKIHFQSQPGLYVTANLYRPKEMKGRAPAILYVCGHGRVKIGGVAYGNKVHYQHHGAWFARHGYVCLTIDSLQLGEIEATHHGTYRYNMWWWNARGYSPAGVEAWNCIRALDYLETRKEVDKARIGVTGRSGGGAYSWWIAALDDRIKAAVPVAGITDLRNHVVDGVVEGHCDCMFVVNTRRWDYAKVAALVAPRALLISNTDKDSIFPLDGVVRVHRQVRHIYDLYGKGKSFGLHITEGPHKDTQNLRVHAFNWMNRHLKGEDPLIDKPAVKFFKPQELKVFAELPKDERNTKIHEYFVAEAGRPSIPTDETGWKAMREKWMAALKRDSFGGFPKSDGALKLKKAFDVTKEGVRFAGYDFESQSEIWLRLYVAHGEKVEKPNLVVLNVLDEKGWVEFLKIYRGVFAEALKEEVTVKSDVKEFERHGRMFKNTKWVMAYLAPRGIGPTVWDQSLKKQTQHRRRFMLLGQTLDGMRVYDVKRGTQAIRKIRGLREAALWLQGERYAAGIALYASLLEKDIKRLDLWGLPTSHRIGPIFLNVSKYLDMPAAVAMAAERSNVRIYTEHGSAWDYVRGVGKALNWPKKKFQVRKPTIKEGK